VPLDRVKDSGAAVLQQVPPVGDMNHTGRAAATAISVAGTTITGDDLHTGMGLQPGRKAIRLTVGQQIDDGTAFQVHENRAVALPSFPRPIVHPEHTRRRGGHDRCATTDEAEQGRTAHGRADPLGQARARLAAQRQADMVLQAAQARCPLRIRPGNSGQALGEDAVCAAGPSAAQPAHPHFDLHAAALPRQICQPAGIAAVQPR